MNEEKISKYTALNSFIKDHPFIEIISEDKYYCKYCVKIYTYRPHEGRRPLDKHISTQAHTRAVDSKLIQKRLEFDVQEGKVDLFDEDLVNMFLSTGIPLHKLETQEMKTFFKKYTGRNLKSTKHYQTTVIDRIYTKKYDQILENLKNKECYLMFDETIDIKGRYILNILVGLWSKNKIDNNPKLIKMVELSKTNSTTVLAEVLNVVSILSDGNILNSKIKLVLSDMAGYALKAGRMLKDIIPSVKHITCLAHMVHLVCETIRKDSDAADNFFALLKRKLTKNKLNQQLFYEITDLKMPKFPVITRWGTWIEFGCFVFENIQKIKLF
ncbi:hypothetical protein DMUE_5723 [Dictyocoela muelleri]|nr:hypothetical protein DMUE_5723 [Dictyocoela muelleri]